MVVVDHTVVEALMVVPMEAEAFAVAKGVIVAAKEPLAAVVSRVAAAEAVTRAAADLKPAAA
jgi:hypothetical protein